jgi:hypothetical protein
VWLELVVSFEKSTPPARVIEHAKRLIAAVHASDPGLGLTWDLDRSREENGDVVIALSPTGAGDVEKRLNDVAAVIQRVTAPVPGVRVLGATVARGRAA